MATNLAALRLDPFYTHPCNHSIITLHIYVLILRQIDSKNYQFHTFFSLLKLTKWNPHQFQLRKKNDEKYQICI